MKKILYLPILVGFILSSVVMASTNSDVLKLKLSAYSRMNNTKHWVLMKNNDSLKNNQQVKYVIHLTEDKNVALKNINIVVPRFNSWENYDKGSFKTAGVHSRYKVQITPNSKIKNFVVGKWYNLSLFKKKVKDFSKYIAQIRVHFYRANFYKKNFTLSYIVTNNF